METLDHLLPNPSRAALPATSEVTLQLPTSTEPLLHDLISSGIILQEDWHALNQESQEQILESPGQQAFFQALVQARLLTPYQANRIQTEGKPQLVIGNYRILDRIGSGGMGIVYRAEHAIMRRPVAIKVLQTSPRESDILLQRFFAEMRALARVRHGNIVWALDAGSLPEESPNGMQTCFLVMEFVEGLNLEQMAASAPLSISQACELAYQIAGALEETHQLNLIHRDIKPSNILVTPQGTAKLLDFGLALYFGRRRLTMPGAVLGTLGYMAPEQVSNAASVDIRADIFGLGATLYYALTGEPPFRPQGNLPNQVAARLAKTNLELRSRRPEISPELESVVRRMMEHNPDDRYPTPQSLLRALLPFINPSNHFGWLRSQPDATLARSAFYTPVPPAPAVPRILVVDDEPGIRQICSAYFSREEFHCQLAANGVEGLQMLAERAFDVVLLDFDMPLLSGTETLRQIRLLGNNPNVRVIMMSGGISPDEMSEMLANGADDYLTKPFNRLQLVSRTRAALVCKTAFDRSDWMHKQLVALNADLESLLTEIDHDLIHTRNSLLYALATIVESRTQEPPGHLARMSLYTRVLARRARSSVHLSNLIDDSFVNMLETCAPLHDIGNVALPDHVLHRAGPLDIEDRMIMQAHTTIGAETLTAVAKRDRRASLFWKMAIDISRHHHERFDGSGYPDRLAGTDIPLSARLVALADTYDTLRTIGEMSCPLSHNAAVEFMVSGSKGRFDPLLLQAFQDCDSEFEKIFRNHPSTARD